MLIFQDKKIIKTKYEQGPLTRLHGLNMLDILSQRKKERKTQFS
jgi:hypothetical protein